MTDLNIDHINDLEYLQFDSIKMDTLLAEEYLKSHQQFHSTECCRRGKEEKVILDSQNNKIYCIKKNNDFHIEPLPNVLRKMTTLTDKLKNNTDLFAQLDYVIRQRSVDEGRLHMDLIIKQFLYWSLSLEESDCVGGMAFIINVTDSAPLLRLGIAGIGLVHHGNVYINATKQMAVICHLFTTLCHEVGLKNVHLILKEQDDYPFNLMYTFDEVTGCAGIISERSDLDSALDIFLASTTTSPWSLKRVYVQESVYDDFKAAMKWKCKRNASEDSDSDLYESDTKMFILDNFDTGIVTTKHVVKVEAYRTTKEVLSLISTWRPYYVSLWASDVAEANVIAHGANCGVVWVNDFGTFEGPNEISNAVYQKGFTAYHYFSITKTISELSKNWEKLTIDRRKHILLQSLANYESNHEIDEEFSEFIRILKSSLRRYENSFIDISNGIMCIGIRKSVGGLRARSNNRTDQFAEALASVVCGGTVWIYSWNYYNFEDFIGSMVESGVPFIVDLDNETPKTDRLFVKPHYPGSFTDVKVIYMPYGTIYGN